MNREQFRAFLWLRWRLRVNQFRKAGTLNAVLFFAIVGLVLVAAVGLFAAGLLVGYLALPGAAPGVRLLVWDGAIVAFLSFWSAGLLSDIQRSDGLAVDKILHLPVSPTGAFLINYLSSLFSLTLIALVPGMVGLILGQALAGSAAVLLALPLLAAFVLAVTAVTYQFQGWLASLMTDPRRRRTVIVVMTGGFILLFQIPNLLNITRPWDDGTEKVGAAQLKLQQAADLDALNAGTLTREEYDRRTKEYAELRRGRSRQTLARAEEIARVASLVLPPGWLAIGAADLADGAVVPALLGTLGLGLIGSVSLWRAYRTSVRLYTGAFTGRGRRPAARPPAPTDPTRVRVIEWRLPRVSESASAVAAATFSSARRAPEVKMALVAPVLMLVLFAGGALSVNGGPPDALRPLMALAAGAFVMLFSGAQLIGNQFGYDRAGFRAYVLSPVPRREILLGRNLAVAPLGIGMGFAVLLLAGTVFPMRADHYPAVAALLVSAYLLLCLTANALSILAPIPIAAGAVQPSNIRAIPMLLQMAFLMTLPIVLTPVFVPFGVEVLLAEVAGVRGVPVALVLAVPVLAATVLVYRWVLTREGEWLAGREQAILEVVAGKE